MSDFNRSRKQRKKTTKELGDAFRLLEEKVDRFNDRFSKLEDELNHEESFRTRVSKVESQIKAYFHKNSVLTDKVTDLTDRVRELEWNKEQEDK